MSDWKNFADDPRIRQTLAAILVDVFQTASDEGRLPCPEAIRSTLFFLFCKDSRDTVLRVNHPELFRACLRFLCTRRTAEELDNLAASPYPVFGSCPCAREGVFEKNKLLCLVHQHFNGHTHSALVTILQALAACLDKVLKTIQLETPLRRLLKARRNAAMHGHKLPWPAGEDDVVPFGARESIDSLCAWTTFLPAPALLSIVNRVYILGTNTSMPSLFVQAIIPRVLMPVVKQSLHQAASHPSTSRGYLDAINSLYYPAQVCRNLVIWDNEQLLDAIGPLRATYKSVAELCNNVQMAVNVAFSSRVKDELEHDIHFYFGGAAHRLCRVLGMPGGLDLAELYQQKIVDPLYSLAGYSQFLARDVLCARAGCHGTPLALGMRLSACGGCGHVYYCSRACQKKAWKDLRGPHRTVCGAIKTITEQLLSAQDSTGSRRLWDSDNRMGFHDQCVKAGVDPSAAKKVANYLRSVYCR